MKVTSLLLLLFSLMELSNADGLNMSFNVKYDKNSHNYNLLINQKAKTNRRLNKLVADKARSLVNFAFKNHDRKIRRILKLLDQKAILTKDPKKQKKIDTLKERVTKVNNNQKEKAAKKIMKVDRKAASLFSDMKQEVMDKIKSFNTADMLKNKENEIIQNIENKYKAQYNMIRGGITNVENNLDYFVPGIKDTIESKINSLEGKPANKATPKKHKKHKKHKKKKKKKRNKKAKGDDIILKKEVKKVDKKIKRHLKKLSSQEIKNNLDFILKKSQSNIDDFEKGFKRRFKHGYGRSLILMSKKQFVDHIFTKNPVWLPNNKDFKQRRRATLINYKKNLIRKLIDSVKKQQWQLITKEGKKFAYIKKMNLYLPADEQGKVDQKMVANLISTLTAKMNDKRRKLVLINKTPSTKDQQKEEKPKVNLIDRKKEAEKDDERDSHEEDDKTNLKKRDLISMPSMPGGDMMGGLAGGAMVGVALGAANAFRKKAENKAKGERMVRTILFVQKSDHMEHEAQRKLYELKNSLRTDYSHLRAIGKGIVFSLDSKYDDLFGLLSEQQID